MSFDEDLRAVFEDKADALSDHHRQMLRRLWEGGRTKGREEMRGQFDQGRTAGLRELNVFFTKVLRKRPTDQVYYLRSNQLEYQPWARAALQQVLDAPDLESAGRVASALEKLSTDALMRRFGQVPPPDLQKVAKQTGVEMQQTEIEMLQSLWERSDDDDMRRALAEAHAHASRRRR